MSLERVYLAADVYMVCLQHALSTDKEEVMGLLIGEIDELNVSHISALIMLQRSDKRKDRVEISPEQLSSATLQAEKLSHELCKPMRVLGWYHSHPHITVWPSHVDVKTQAAYQMLDEGFIGIIMSVFTEDKGTKEQHIQMTCFQSQGDNPNFTRVEVPLYIESTSLSRPCLQSMVDLPQVLFQEERNSFSVTADMTFLSTLAKIYNKAALTKSLCRITEDVSGPIVMALEQRKAMNIKRIQDLKEERQRLLALHSS